MNKIHATPRLRHMVGLWLLLCFFAVPAAHAQDQTVNCPTALEDAEGAYNLGEFDEVIRLLDTCIQRGTFNQAQLRQAYRLMGLSYIGKQLEVDAKSAIAELLTLVPDYEPHPVNDPPTFARMVSEVKTEQAATERANTNVNTPGNTTPPPPQTGRKRWLLIGGGAVAVGVLAAVLAGGGGGGGGTGGLPGPPPLPGGN